MYLASFLKKKKLQFKIKENDPNSQTLREP